MIRPRSRSPHTQTLSMNHPECNCINFTQDRSEEIELLQDNRAQAEKGELRSVWRRGADGVMTLTWNCCSSGETEYCQNRKRDVFHDVVQAVQQLGRFPVYHKNTKDSFQHRYEHNLRRQIEIKRKQNFLSLTEYLTLRSKNEGYLNETHSGLMQRLTNFLLSLQANGEAPRMPLNARGMDGEETQLRRQLDVHMQRLDEALCVLAALIMPEQEEYVFSLISSDTKVNKKSEFVRKLAEAAVCFSQSARAFLEHSPDKQTQFGARLTALDCCKTNMQDVFDEIREAKARSSVKDQLDLMVRFQQSHGGRLPFVKSHAFEKKSGEEKQAAGILRRLRQARIANVTELRRRRCRLVQRQLMQDEVIMFEEQFGAEIWCDLCVPTAYSIPAVDIHD